MRELSTPTLPTFISSCLNLISINQENRAACSSVSLSESVLAAFCELVCLYPSAFKPFVSRIQMLLLSWLAPILSCLDARNPSSAESDPSFASPMLCHKGRQLFVRLHMSASKGALNEEWNGAHRTLAAEFTETANYVFRSVDEGWKPSAISPENHSRLEDKAGKSSRQNLGL